MKTIPLFTLDNHVGFTYRERNKVSLMCPFGLSVIVSEQQLIKGWGRRFGYFYDCQKLSEKHTSKQDGVCRDEGLPNLMPAFRVRDLPVAVTMVLQFGSDRPYGNPFLLIKSENESLKW